MLNANVGSMYVQRMLMVAPVAPMKKALTANITTFTLLTLTPLCAAASSDSPMLRKARPNLERLMR